VVTPEVIVTVMGSVFVFGVIITSACALISINKYLRMRVSELYYI
jgi:cell division transport system permease protein